MIKYVGLFTATLFVASVASAPPALAQGNSECAGLPTHAELAAAMEVAAGPGSGIVGANRGFGLEMWGTVVNRDGIVCAVVFTGNTRGDQWPGSRLGTLSESSTDCHSHVTACTLIRSRKAASRAAT